MPNQRYKCVLASAADVPMARIPTNAAAIVVRVISFLSIAIYPYHWLIDTKSPLLRYLQKQDTQFRFTKSVTLLPVMD
jgi:hypothetical protein